MTPAMIGTGPANFIVFAVLAVFGIIGWFSIRRNIRGIDFDEVPIRQAGSDDAGSGTAESGTPEFGTAESGTPEFGTAQSHAAGADDVTSADSDPVDPGRPGSAQDQG